MQAPPKPATVTASVPSARALALQALCLSDPARKVAATHALFGAMGGASPIDPGEFLQPDAGAPLPGRPAKPDLIAPADVPQRSPATPRGLAALVHAICHIEYNAINLALDAVWRFAGMPPDFYGDWARVADEEATHFSLLNAHLAELGFAYGDFPAHNGLWEMCVKTQDDITARMALVPRTLEARGLDATPLIQAKLRQVKSDQAQRTVEILDVILRDEIGHVAVGNRWYGWLCQRQGLDPLVHYRLLARRHNAPRLRPPFNEAARRAAGFSAAELANLNAMQ